VKDPISCRHCGGLASHRRLPDGTDCPTARLLGLLEAARRVLPSEPAPKVTGRGGKA
jgi:hypothetical protein